MNAYLFLGKTGAAVQLAKKYSAALLTIDGVILDALSNGNTPAGLRARELCADAAKRRAEELKALAGEDAEKKNSGGLSMEAVQAHTAGQGAIFVIILFNKCRNDKLFAFVSFSDVFLHFSNLRHFHHIHICKSQGLFMCSRISGCSLRSDAGQIYPMLFRGSAQNPPAFKVKHFFLSWSSGSCSVHNS